MKLENCLKREILRGVLELTTVKCRMRREVGLVVVLRIVRELVRVAGRKGPRVAAMMTSQTSEAGHVRGVHGE